MLVTNLSKTTLLTFFLKLFSICIIVYLSFYWGTLQPCSFEKGKYRHSIHKLPLTLVDHGENHVFSWMFKTPELCNANAVMDAVYEGEGPIEFLEFLQDQRATTFHTRALKDVMLGEARGLIRLKDEVTGFLKAATSELESSENISRFIQQRIKLSHDKNHQEKLKAIAQDVLNRKSEENKGQKMDISKFGDFEVSLNRKKEIISNGKLMLKNMICSRHFVLERFFNQASDDILYEYFTYIRYLNFLLQEIEEVKINLDNIKQREDVKTNFE